MPLRCATARNRNHTQSTQVHNPDALHALTVSKSREASGLHAVYRRFRAPAAQFNNRCNDRTIFEKSYLLIKKARSQAAGSFFQIAVFRTNSTHPPTVV